MYHHIIVTLTLGCIGLPVASAQDWKSLIKDDAMEEWQIGGQAASFQAKGGTLTVNGPGQIVYVGEPPLDLLSFELKTEVLTKPGGRAGFALHASTEDPRSSSGIEVVIDNSYSGPKPGVGLLKTGSLKWLRPVVKSPVPDNRWFPMHISVQGRRIQVRVDNQLVVDYIQPENLSEGPRLRHGSIAIRGHDGSGEVQFRNLQVRPLKEDPTPAVAPRPDEIDLRLARLREQGFLLIDFHARLQDGLTVDDVMAHGHRTTLGYGLVAQAGQGQPVADDKSAEAFLKSLQGRPVFVGLQAEGRDWHRLFSPAVLARFDYILTDARTVTDYRGRRTRLWVKEEVDIPDPQAFMDQLVKTIEDILDRYPIDIYANPTYLPEVIAADYDRLWTAERMRRVVEALVRNGVALEINENLRLPKPALIKMAKQAGVKFAFGGNNSDRTLGRLEYGLRMVDECGLTPEDQWAPRPEGKKPVQVRKVTRK